MNYRIDILSHEEVNSEYWNDLAENCRESSPFSLYQYNSLFSNDDVFYIVVADMISGHYLAGISGRTKGKLPLLGAFFATVIVETSVLVREDAGDVKAGMKKLIYRELVSYTKQLGAMRVFMNHWSREKDRDILEMAGFRVEVNTTFEIPADVTHETVFENYNYRCRNTIRKAIGKNVNVKILTGDIPEASIEEAVSLAKLTFMRAYGKNRGTSMQLKNDQFYEALFKYMPVNSSLGIAYTEDMAPASFAVVLYNRWRSIYYRGGSDLERNRFTGSSNLLIDCLIRDAICRNISVFDMGGVPNNPGKSHPAYGVYKFKESFGGFYREYYSGTMICSPLRSVIFDWLLYNRFMIRIYTIFRPVN